MSTWQVLVSKIAFFYLICYVYNRGMYMNNENKFFGPDQETNQDMQQETPIQVEEPI